MKGFSLIELLVIVAVTTMLAGFFIAYNSSSRQQINLYVEQAKIAQLVLKAKSLTLSGTKDASLPCGYGFHVDYAGKKYSVFSYKENNCDTITSIDRTGDDPTKIYKEIDGFSLTEGEVFDPANNLPHKLDDILFIPPNPDTLIWVDGGIQDVSGNIYLATSDGTGHIKVFLGPGGQISF